MHWRSHWTRDVTRRERRYGQARQGVPPRKAVHLVSTVRHIIDNAQNSSIDRLSRKQYSTSSVITHYFCAHLWLSKGQTSRSQKREHSYYHYRSNSIEPKIHISNYVGNSLQLNDSVRRMSCSQVENSGLSRRKTSRHASLSVWSI